MDFELEGLHASPSRRSRVRSLKAIVAAGAGPTAFESLNSHTAMPTAEMAATASLPGFTCAISASGKVSFFSCKQPNQDGAALQAATAKQAAAAAGSLHDSVSQIPVAAKRPTVMIVRWSPSMGYVGADVRVTAE